MNVLTGTTSAGMGSTVIMLVLMIAIFYFMLIRPENKRRYRGRCCGREGKPHRRRDQRRSGTYRAGEVGDFLQRDRYGGRQGGGQEGAGSQGKGQGRKESRQGEEGLIAGRSKVFEKLKIRPMPMASGGFYMPNSTKNGSWSVSVQPLASPYGRGV